MVSNPVWEQLLEFDIPTTFYGFKMECYDKRKLRADKIIGQVMVKVNPDVYEQDINDEWLPLTHKGAKGGEIQLRVQSDNKPTPPRSNSNVAVNNTTPAPTPTPAPTITTTPSTPATSTTQASSTTSTTSTNELTRSSNWENPATTENLLKKSYVIIEEEFQDGTSSTNESDTTTPPSSRSKLTTSFKPSPDPSEEDEEEEDEEMDDEDDEQMQDDGEEDEYDEDNDKDYQDWDAVEEEEDTKPKSLSTSGIFQAREAKITKVKDILGVPSHIAQALLQHFQWDEEKFLMRFLENPAGIYKEAKLEAPKEQKDGANNVGQIECSVCFEDDQDEITALGCNHYFCNDCWKTHIQVALKEGRSLDITCMQHKCKELMPDYIVRKVVDMDTYKKYSAFLSKGFVESNANMKWCPKPGCTNAVDITQSFREGKCVVAKCECGYKFCFLCSEDSHTPASCGMMKEWAKKCADDSETYNWIAANTKDCPQKNCGVPIEKNDGCFMMTCQKCRYQFCWLCCESWASHNDHFRCNKFNEGKLENKPSWMDGRTGTEARSALDRYLFYYNRFINHQNSLKFEDKSREKARNTMEALQKDGSHSYIDVQFIEAALNQLLENRRTLKNTYVYAFYQADPLKKDLFEFSQADLEKITERMGQLLLENPENLIKSATTVKSMTQVAARSLSNLLFDENL